MNGYIGRYKLLATLAVLLTISTLMPGYANSATPPVVTRLLQIENQNFAGKVAADAAGNVYVADVVKNTVQSFTFNGALRFSLQLDGEPLSLAVSPANLLYVGKAVKVGPAVIDVFTTAGKPVKTLTGFQRPVSMAFLSTGELFLIDGYQLKKFDGSMNPLASIGGYGTFPDPASNTCTVSCFIDPSSVTVNELRSEVYVLDRGYCSYFQGCAWRVQVFNLALNPIGWFSSYGYGQDGKIGATSSVAIDKQGRLYMADHVQSVIMVFDATNTSYVTNNTPSFVSIVYDLNKPIYSPVNIAFANDRLYIASILSNSAMVYGVDTFAQMKIDPAALDFTYQIGLAASKDITVSNTGTGDLTWSATTDAAWLAVSPVNGVVKAAASQAVKVTVDPSTLSVGAYKGNITFQSNSGTETIPVTLTVVAPPQLTVSPTTLTVKKTAGEAPTYADLAIQISNDITGARTWNAVAASDSGWLGISSPSGGNNIVQPPVQAIIKDAALGKHTGVITVTLDGAPGISATVTVNLEVVKATTIAVATNIAEGSFTISGPATYTGTGQTSYSFNNVAPGVYTITFARVQGFKTPLPQTATVASGGSISFSGIYTDLRKKLNIIASHGPDSRNSSEVSVFAGDGTLKAGIMPFSYKYGSTTAAGDFDGDGLVDIIVGGGGQRVPAVVKGFHRDGTPVAGLEFTAYKTKSGVNVAAADFDGDGRDELITGDRKSTYVRVFSYDKGIVSDTGVYFEAYPNTDDTGVIVAAADLDGDGRPELVTVPEREADGTVPSVHIYKIDTSGGPGRWKAVLVNSFKACDILSATAMTTGDINGDGTPKILVVCSAKAGGTEIREFTSAGALIRTVPLTSTRISAIAAGDINSDGIAEIILGDPASRTVRIMDAAGTEINRFDAFTDSSIGVRVSVGNLGY